METVDFFRKVDLFRFPSDGQLQRLASQARTVAFPEGNIIKDRDSADGLYIVKSGNGQGDQIGDRDFGRGGRAGYSSPGQQLRRD